MIALYEKYASKRPTMEVLTILASHYQLEKQHDKTIATYQKMIKLQPQEAGLYAGIGYVYSLKGDIDKAIANYKASLRYDREDDRVYYRLGEAYEQKGMYQEALAEYTRAHQINPDARDAARKIPQMRIRMLQQKHRGG